MGILNMDWDKHGTQPTQVAGVSTGTRRCAVPVTPQLETLIELFRTKYPHKNFSKTAVMKTFLEAGAKVWYEQQEEPDV